MTAQLEPYVLPFDVVEAKTLDEFRAELGRSDVVISSRESWPWLADGLTADLNKLIGIESQLKLNFDDSALAGYRDHAAQIENRWQEFFSTRRQVLTFHSPPKVNAELIRDGIVRVGGGSLFHHLNDALKKMGRCFPPAEKRMLHHFAMMFSGTRLDEALMRNSPSIYDLTLGTWPERIAGFTLLTATGDLIHVDRESGWEYDGMNLLECVAGTNGALGFLMEVDILTIPLSENTEEEIVDCPGRFNACRRGPFDTDIYWWCQRVPVAVLEQAIHAAKKYVSQFHRKSGLMVGGCPMGHKIPRYESDHVAFCFRGDDNVEFKDSDLVPRIQTAKKRLDPDNRLNPRAVSIL